MSASTLAAVTSGMPWSMEWGDEVDPDDPVRRSPADKEAPRKEPELRRPRGPTEHPSPLALGVRDGRSGLGGRALLGGVRLLLPSPVRPEPHPGGIVPHKEQDRDEDEEGHDREVNRPLAPADGHDEPHQGRDGDELAGGGRGPEDAEHEPAPLDEPAVGDRCAEDGGDDAGADAAEGAPEQVELPELGHGGAHQGAAPDHREAEEDYPFRAEAVHKPAGRRAGEAVEEEAYGDGEGDRGPAPAELAFERVDEHRRRSPHPGRDEERQKDDPDHDPAVVEPPADRFLQGISFP